jgi:phosphoserine phosphatase
MKNNKPAALWLTALICSALLGACAQTPPDASQASPTAQSQGAIKLAQRNWDTFNKAQIEKLLVTYGKASPGYNPAKPPYAVFDWDNTMVFLDVEEATLIYQLENLRFAMTPEQLAKALRMAVPKTDFVKDYNNAAGQPVNVDRAADDAVDSYRWIYANYAGMQGKLPLAEIKKNPHYSNFVTKVRYLYEAIGDSFDVSVAYPWVLYLFTGMNEAQIRGMVNETLAWQQTQPIEKVKWTSPASLPGKAGVVSVSWKNGLRLMPEMQELIHAFRAAGIDTWICTASFVDVIKEISSNPAYGYNNPADRVIGMELERDANGVVQTEFRRGYAQTQQKGKTQAIERFLVSKYGYGPIFVAGDSEGDMNMMQDFADTKLVLIINRLKGKDIATLSKQAVASYGQPDAKVLLQGRNDNTGQFVASQAHVKFGGKDGQVLK